MLDLWTDLLGCLDLHRASDSADADDASFDGVSQQLDYHRVFGGQLLGQFIRAASLACPEKAVKSLHAVFAREGRAAEPVRYRATRQHEGRSFASLTITAHQPQAVLASAAVSMHASEDGPENQDCEPISTLLDDAHRVELDLIPWETRSADDLTAAATAPPRFEFWMRTPTVDEALAPALTAYATDLTLIGTALRPFEGFGHRGNGTQFTSAVTSTPSGFTSGSAPTGGCCCDSTVRCWQTVDASGAAMSWRKTARWSRRMRRRRCCAFATTVRWSAHDAELFAYRTSRPFGECYSLLRRM